MTLETARLMNLLEYSHRLLRERAHDDDETNDSVFLELQMAHDRAITGVLRLSAQASEIAASHASLFESKQELEQAVRRLEVNRSS